jgi:hypothetical protein
MPCRNSIDALFHLDIVSTKLRSFRMCRERHDINLFQNHSGFMIKVARSCPELRVVQLPIECCDSPLFERFLDGNTNVARLNHPNAGIWISFFLGLSVPGVSKVYHNMFDSHRLMAIGHMWTPRRVSQRPGVQFMEIHWWRRPSGRKELSMGWVEPKDEVMRTRLLLVPNFGSFTGWRRFTRRDIGETHGISFEENPLANYLRGL